MNKKPVQTGRQCGSAARKALFLHSVSSSPSGRRASAAGNLDQPRGAHRAVGRAGAGQHGDRPAGDRLDQPLIKPSRRLSGRKDRLDRRAGEDRPEIVCHRVPDGRVARPPDPAAGEGVPQRDPPAQRQRPAPLRGAGILLPQQGGEGRPEPVAGMGIVELRRAGAGRGHGAQNQHPAVRRPDRRERMMYQFLGQRESPPCKIGAKKIRTPRGVRTGCLLFTLPRRAARRHPWRERRRRPPHSPR